MATDRKDSAKRTEEQIRKRRRKRRKRKTWTVYRLSRQHSRSRYLGSNFPDISIGLHANGGSFFMQYSTLGKRKERRYWFKY